jgi:hypothetical protein
VGDLLFDNGTSASCIEPLLCGTDYVIHAFGHATSALNRSDFTANTTCSTQPCTPPPSLCTLSQGYWRTHNETVCASDPASPLCVTWPVSGLTLGTVFYTNSQLVSILNQSAAGGNGLVSLAHQLIAVKLDIARGTDGSAIAGDVAAADALIGGLVVPPVGAGSLPGSVTGTLTNNLDTWIGSQHCLSDNP